MAITLQQITSVGIEEAWIEFARHHWAEHVPAEMESWFDVDVASIQQLEAIGRIRSFAAMEGDVTLGYALVICGPQLFTRSTHEWTIQCIYTHPAARRKGVFDQIMKAVEAEAVADGAVMLNMMAPAGFSAHDYMINSGFWTAEVTYRKQVN